MRPGSWVPPVVWMAVIAGFSTSPFGAGTTGQIVPPLVGWLLPWLAPEHVELIHIGVRKGAHVAEYALLAWLWWRAFARDRVLAPRAALLASFALCVAWACVDESLQALAPGRGSRALDVVIDATGAGTALAFVAGGWRTLDRLVGALLWIAAAGGAALLALNAAAGVPSGALWITAPLAALALFARRRWPRRA